MIQDHIIAIKGVTNGQKKGARTGGSASRGDMNKEFRLPSEHLCTDGGSASSGGLKCTGAIAWGGSPTPPLRRY